MDEIEIRIAKAHSRYGDYASTHEALGVASEEWDELKQAVRSNDQQWIADECFDLAAVLIRLARMLRCSDYAHDRSAK